MKDKNYFLFIFYWSADENMGRCLDGGGHIVDERMRYYKGLPNIQKEDQKSREMYGYCTTGFL